MNTGSMVKIRFKRYFEKQKLWFFVGKVEKFTDAWVTVHGKGIVFDTGHIKPLNIDEDSRSLMIPAVNISHIRLLPDGFDVSKIEAEISGKRWVMKVNGAPDASLVEN